jgi:nicotinamidase-related amidase
MHTALLLIDVQESFRHRPYWSETDAARFLERTNALLAGCAAAGVPIVRVLHADGPDTAANPFAPASGHVRPMTGLAACSPVAEFRKSRHSALVGTGLLAWLREHGVRRVIVAGIRTEQCCETTARHASDEGFEVDYVSEATLTFDMKHLDGTPLPAPSIIARTEAVLKDRFATICSVERALERARESTAQAA